MANNLIPDTAQADGSVLYICRMEPSVFLRKHIEDIIALSDEEFAVVLSHFYPRTLKKKEYLIRGGQTVHSKFFVVKGLLKGFI